MNILFTNFHPGNGGGHRTYINYIFHNLNHKDLKLFIAIPQSSKLADDFKKRNYNNLFFIEYPVKFREFGSFTRNLFRLNSLISKYSIDVVHTNGNPDHKLVAFCKFIFNNSFYIVRTKHNSSPIKDNYLHKKLYGKYCDHLIVVSQYQYDSIKENNIRDKTVVIKNGIDLNFFVKKIPKPKSLLKKFNIKGNDIVLVSNAGTALHKGWPMMLEAVSEVDPKLRKFLKIIIIGNHPNDDILKRFVIPFSIEDQVFFTGFLDDVRGYLSLGDIGFVLSSSIETISYACREMMAMGLPVIVTNNGGLSENIDHKKSGWIIKNNDIESLKAILENLFKLDLVTYSSNATEKANSEFGIDLFIKQMAKFYQDILIRIKR